MKLFRFTVLFMYFTVYFLTLASSYALSTSQIMVTHVRMFMFVAAVVWTFTKAKGVEN